MGDESDVGVGGEHAQHLVRSDEIEGREPWIEDDRDLGLPVWSVARTVSAEGLAVLVGGEMPRRRMNVRRRDSEEPNPQRAAITGMVSADSVNARRAASVRTRSR